MGGIRNINYRGIVKYSGDYCYGSNFYLSHGDFLMIDDNIIEEDSLGMSTGVYVMFEDGIREELYTGDIVATDCIFMDYVDHYDLGIEWFEPMVVEVKWKVEFSNMRGYHLCDTTNPNRYIPFNDLELEDGILVMPEIDFTYNDFMDKYKQVLFDEWLDANWFYFNHLNIITDSSFVSVLRDWIEDPKSCMETMYYSSSEEVRNSIRLIKDK